MSGSPATGFRLWQGSEIDGYACGSHLRRYARTACAVIVALFVMLGSGAHADDDKLRTLGKRLSGECTSCHRLDAQGDSIPSITGWDTDEFVTTLHFYAKGERTHQAMGSVAQSLDERQMRALALYFGSLPRPAKGQRPSAAKGK